MKLCRVGTDITEDIESAQAIPRPVPGIMAHLLIGTQSQGHRVGTVLLTGNSIIDLTLLSHIAANMLTGH